MMRAITSRARRALGLAALIGASAAILLPASAADAQIAGEHIARYVVTLDIHKDGALGVSEDITYDFGVVPRHGIYRNLVVSETYDTHHDRRYNIEDLQVAVDPGTPGSFSTSRDGRYLKVRIGDPDRTITGVHRYVITYTVKGATRAWPDHDELYWDAIGNEWPVPIQNAKVIVTAPAKVIRTACFTGPQGSTFPCDAHSAAGSRALYSDSLLGSYSGLTIVAALPPGTLQPPPQPILERLHSFQDAFAVRPNTVIPGGLLAAVIVGLVLVFAWRHGRDRRYAGSAVDAAFGNTSGAEEAVPLGGMDAGPVEFVPPDKILPGEVGTLVDEQANLVDVTATIIDLAVRGWLTITDLSDGNYELGATATAGKGTLQPYEIALMDALFKNRTSVTTSELKYKFRAELTDIQSKMYDDVVARGWYHTRPDRTRLTWAGAGLLAFVIAVGITIAVAVTTSFGIVALALVVGAIALLGAAGHMPARTPKGSAVLSRVRGFRRLFDEGDEDIRARFAEQHNIFSEYLPYAIVFGCADKWANAFKGLAAEELGATDWYRGPNMLDAVLLAHAVDSFSTVATGTMYASAPSSSSGSGFGGGGFSGGGGGGGGGGSW